MRETVELSGVVLYAQPVGEYDRRLVVLTRERGKITVFAHGVRRPKSPWSAASNPFVFAVFTLYEGRDSYSLNSVQPIEYFTELAASMPGVFYGYYFLELASYYGREGLEAAESVNLLYVTLRAILREKMPLSLIRAVYELRTLTDNGEYVPPAERGTMHEAAFRALHFLYSCSLKELYAFQLAEEAQRQVEKEAAAAVGRLVDKSFKSLAVIEKIE